MNRSQSTVPKQIVYEQLEIGQDIDPSNPDNATMVQIAQLPFLALAPQSSFAAAVRETMFGC